MATFFILLILFILSRILFIGGLTGKKGIFTRVKIEKFLTQMQILMKQVSCNLDSCKNQPLETVFMSGVVCAYQYGYSLVNNLGINEIKKRELLNEQMNNPDFTSACVHILNKVAVFTLPLDEQRSEEYMKGLRYGSDVTFKIFEEVFDTSYCRLLKDLFLYVFSVHKQAIAYE